MRVQVKQKQWIVVMILMLLLSMVGTASAEEIPTVTITAQVQQVEQMVSGEVTISTIDPTLFHDQIKLSWHIYDETGNDLVYENERIPVTLGDGQTVTIPVKIDLSVLALPPQKITIQFDLVDEENLFWFADYSGIVLEREGVVCEIQAPQVKISCMEGTQIPSKQLNTQVQIDFGDTNLYHEGLKLSWHTVDKNGQEIAFENERIPVPAPIDGVSTVELSLDFRENDRLSGEKYFTLQLDLVDEVNGYWYSQNPAIDFQTQELTYAYHFVTAFQNTFSNAMKNQPIVLVLNLLVDLILVGIVIYFYRTKWRKTCK